MCICVHILSPLCYVYIFPYPTYILLIMCIPLLSDFLSTDFVYLFSYLISPYVLCVILFLSDYLPMYCVYFFPI